MQIVVVSEKERQWFEPFLPPEFCGSQAQTQLLYGAVDDQTGTAVGAMLVEAADDIVELQWICVADEWRQKGIARQMIDALLEDAEQVQSLHAIHVMLSCREQAAATLLRRCGFRVYPSEYQEYAFPLAMAQQGAFWQRPVSCSGSILPLSAVPQQAVQTFNRQAARGDKLRGVEPIRLEECDGALSLCCLLETEIVGALLVRADSRGSDLDLQWLYADAAHPRVAAALLQQAAAAALRSFLPETTVHLAALTPEAEALVKKLLPAAEQQTGWIAWRQIAGSRVQEEQTDVQAE